MALIRKRANTQVAGGTWGQPYAFDDSRGLMDALQADLQGFERLSARLKEVCGISLPPNVKNYCLMASRLHSVLRSRGLARYSEYIQLLDRGEPAVVQEFISALTTNTTEFLREAKHFEIFKTLIPQILAEKQKTGNREIRLWCAAASTGQEPYTILMTLLDLLPAQIGWDIRFLATDIDHGVLGRASEGVYSEAEIKNVPDSWKEKYFLPYIEKKGQRWIVREQIRSMIRFAPFNLLSDPFPFQHRFDVVFCRNVLIYFERATSEGVVARIANSINPGGYLFLGHSESGAMRSELLKPIASAAYQRKKS